MAFGRTKRHPGGTTVTTTTTTTHHPAPKHGHGAGHGAVTAKPSFMQRLRARNTTPRNTTAAPRSTRTHRSHGLGTHSTPTTAKRSRFGRTKAAPVATHHHQRKASIGDKMSGAMLKLRGSLTHRPGVKAAGARRMHGTDGRGSRRYY